MKLFSTLPDDPDLRSEIAETFLEEGPRLLLEIQNAVRKNDCVALEQAAHALKGALAEVGAQAAFNSAQELEMLAKARNLKGADHTLHVLKVEMEHLNQALRAIVSGTGVQ